MSDCCSNGNSSLYTAMVFTLCFLHLLRILHSTRSEREARRIDNEVPYLVDTGFVPLSECFHLKTQKRYEAYRIGEFKCKQETNPL